MTQHIMISYQWDDKPYCIKMKDYLQKNGFKVWMDVENMYGSIIEAMADAVDNAYCILMCMSEKYRNSINCKKEAVYADKKNKKIIPLVMQSGYTNPDGW